MFSDDLAWALRHMHASTYEALSVDTLKTFQTILQHHRPDLNSDLATMAIYRCQDCVRMALQKLDTNLSLADSAGC